VSSIEFQAKIATARTARPRPQAVAMPSLFMRRPFVSPLRVERRCSLRLPRQAAGEFIAGAAISSRRSRSALGGADGDAGELLVDLDDGGIVLAAEPGGGGHQEELVRRAGERQRKAQLAPGVEHEAEI